MPAADLNIRLQPRARRNAIVEERDGVLRVSVAAAPVDGLANAALCKLIAKRAGIARSRVRIVWRPPRRSYAGCAITWAHRSVRVREPADALTTRHAVAPLEPSPRVWRVKSRLQPSDH